MNKEKTAFSLSSGSLFVPVKPPSFTFSQIQPAFDPSRVPPEKHPNCASQIVRALTSRIIPTFNKCNPKFQYEPASNPKRCLTAPAEGVYNNGHDNINNEYILYVNDVIKSPENEEYLILELLGKGTFGQVIRCIRKSQKDQFAVKVIKNKPAYTNQALTEVKIYKKLKEEAISNEDHIVRLFDYFVFRNHICLIFELLHISLYDLLRLSNFSGFSLKFIGRLTEQIIDSMTCLERNKIIHCDLKPENVLFADEESDSIKVIDLGSSCFLHSTVYTYIQSRFYRAPEVILGSKYTNKIDSWSLGCMAAEFYLGLPLFPGNSEYDQLKRIIDILGTFEDEVIENGRFKNKFFKRENDTYAFKTAEEFEQEQNTKLQPHKKYFLLKKLEDLEMYYNKSKQREKQPQEKQRFDMFVHFLKGLLQINPAKRWTASQAKFHPFLTGAPFEPNWEPLPHHEAMEESRKLIVKSEDPNKPADSNPFHKATPELFNAESYRPAITEKKEEVSNQTVYLINSQATSSTKPKSKLNAKAANFSTGFQVPALNLDPQATGFNAKQKGSQSEPNSARNSFRKQGKDANEVQFSYQEEKEEYVEGQEEQNKDQKNTGQGVQGGQKDFKQQQQQQYQGKGGYRDANNASHNEQFYPSGQYGNYQQGGYQPRQRSNSDQGSSENIFFQQNKGKQYQQQQQYQQYPPQQFQQYPPQQFQQYPPQQFQQYPPQQFQQYPPQQFPPQQYQQYQQFQQHPQQYQQQQYQGNNQFQNNTYNQQYNQFQGGMGQHNQGYANAGNQPKHGKKWSGSHGKGGSGYKNQHGNNNSSQYDEKEELKEK